MYTSSSNGPRSAEGLSGRTGVRLSLPGERMFAGWTGGRVKEADTGESRLGKVVQAKGGSKHSCWTLSPISMWFSRFLWPAGTWRRTESRLHSSRKAAANSSCQELTNGASAAKGGDLESHFLRPCWRLTRPPGQSAAR
jgi:hypothetical protein